MADTRLLLFRNPGGGTYRTRQSGSEWEMIESEHPNHTAPAIERCALYQHAPNPFDPATAICDDIPKGAGDMSL